MIRRISVENQKNKKYTPVKHRDNVKNSPAFTGLGSAVSNALIKGMQICEAEPMLNVTVLDLSTAIIPRSIIETVAASKVTDENGNPVYGENGKQKRKFNLLAGFEAFRREGSGLLINCILPGAFVVGAAKLLNGPFKIMGKNSKSNLTKNWADEATLNTINTYYKGTGTSNYFETIRNMFVDLKGADGKIIDKSFAEMYKSSTDEFNGLFKELAKIANSETVNQDSLKEVIKHIVNKTHISENIKFTVNNPKGEYFGNSLESLLKNTVEVLHDAQKDGIEGSESFKSYISQAKRLTKMKSRLGMAIVLPLAIAAQPINRWITHKTSGKKGAPIYNDDEVRHLTPEEKAKLNKQKVLSIGSMLGLAWLSMMKMPSLKMLEFKKYFPTMDQARIVSTATFASRMGASEDFNDLREATVRDLATFSSFYFLGDYAAKAIATGIEKANPKIKLINELRPLKENANIFEKLWHWTKYTAIKSTNEITNPKTANLRSVCQLGNLTFSLIALGLFIPLINRIQTNKKEQARKQQLAIEKGNANNAASSMTSTGSTGASVVGAASEGYLSDAKASVRGWELDLIDKKTTAFGAFLNS